MCCNDLKLYPVSVSTVLNQSKIKLDHEEDAVIALEPSFAQHE
jgi:hypothetical protein